MLHQALGVELYFYIRCPTCFKLLGHLEDEYRSLIKIAEEEISNEFNLILSKSPLNIKEKTDIYNGLVAERFIDIMKRLGIKRYCCMHHMRFPQQVPVGNPTPPPGNIAITKYMLDGSGLTRNPTLIQLTKPSRIPGGSNVNLMSITGHEDITTLDPIERYIFKQYISQVDYSASFGFIPPKDAQGTFIESHNIMTAQPISSEEVQVSLPTIQSGSFKTIKRKPKVQNVEIVGMTDPMDVVQLNEPPSQHQDIFPEESNFMDIENLKIF